MKSNKVLMQEAREVLRGRWAMVVIYHFLSIVISGFVAGVFLVMAPLELGLSAIYLKSARKHTVKWTDFFSGFTKGYWKSIGLVMLTGLIIFAVALLLSALIALVAGVTGWFSYEFNWFERLSMLQTAESIDVLWALITVVLMPIVLALVAYIMVGIALSQSSYIWVDHPKLGIRDTFKLSMTLIKGCKWQYFCLGWRFVGWGVLSVFFTFGIGFLWLIPYIRVTQARFYDELVLEYDKLKAGVRDVKAKPVSSSSSAQDKMPDIYKNH